MAAEKQIVKYWLNKKGFYTIDNVKAGNRSIDFIAISFKEGKINQLNHIEVSCSISSTAVNLSKLKEGINKHIKIKFSNPVINFFHFITLDPSAGQVNYSLLYVKYYLHKG